MAIKCPKCQTENPETARFCLDCGTQLILQNSKDFHLDVTKTLQAPIHELTTGSAFAGAIKLIKPEIAQAQETIERFSNELKLARKIRHKNVCGMFDISESEGAHFITMEYVGGEDLKSMIRMTGMLGVGTVQHRHET